MNTGAQPVHKTTGQRGPVCEFATIAWCWVIVTQPDPRSWRVDPIAPQAMPPQPWRPRRGEPLPAIFNPAPAHFVTS